MRITYMFQSGFFIESNSAILIIDYYKADNESIKYLCNLLRTTDKKVYILVSHSHEDHFNNEIFDWININNEIIYIISSEIVLDIKENNLIEKIITLDKFETFNDEVIYIKAYGSTDLGASFYIKLDNKDLFHAGDLNNWHWNEEFSEKEMTEAENFYLSELSIIAHDIKSIDILFFPLDPRLGKDYAKGAIQFMSKIKTGILIPMHFGTNILNYNKTQKTLKENINYKFKLIEINKENFKITV